MNANKKKSPKSVKSNSSKTSTKSQQYTKQTSNPRAVNSVMRYTNGRRLQFNASTTQDAARYVAAVLDPVNAPEGVRVINDNFSQPTATLKMVFKGNFVTNASGNFAIFANPLVENSGNMIVLYNDSTYAPTTGTQTPAASVSVQKSTYIANNQLLDFRIVACSLQIKYEGTTLNKAGSLHSAFMTQSFSDAAAAVGPTTTDLADSYFYALVDPSNIAEVIWIPRDDIDMDFQGNTTSKSNSCLFVQGVGLTASSPMSYQLVIHTEYHPSLANRIASVKTVEADSDSVSVIKTAMRTALNTPKYITSPANDDWNVNKAIENGLMDIPDSASEMSYRSNASTASTVRSVAKSVATLVGTTLSAMPNPYAKAAGAFVNLAASAA